jgi:glyoxylase-like metal-dependent hydrolase (beta-lactamase superfamily II)
MPVNKEMILKFYKPVYVILILSMVGCQSRSLWEADLTTQHWIHGAADCKANSDPPIQVVRFAEDSWILRQNKCDHYEAPFMFLFIGSSRALLVDTGALEEEKYFPLLETIRRIILQREDETGLQYQLTVAHTHSHGDHHAADIQFTKQGIAVVGLEVADITTFFKIEHWPADSAVFDLGDRPLLILPSPGHHASAISIYDARTQILLTGDTFYPGRLYVDDWTSFRKTIKMLSAFSRNHRIRYILGNHIEMSATPGVDYPTGSTFQPHEAPLPLTADDLRALDHTLDSLGEVPVRKVLGKVIISPK